MAIASIDTFLMNLNATTKKFEKLLDIKTFPDLGGAPETIDVTTLSDHVQKNLAGIQKMSALAFTANFDKDDYAKVVALEGTDQSWAVVLGATPTGTPDGHNGIFKFRGEISVYLKSGKVNDPIEMDLSIAASTAPAIDAVLDPVGLAEEDAPALVTE